MEKIILFAIYVVDMLLVIKLIFWISAFIIGYTYIGYPLVLAILARFSPARRAAPPVSAGTLPPVSLIVAAYNEADLLEQKIVNCLELNYPAELLHIIFVTDGSTDESNEILRRYPSITVLFEPRRRGKLAAMNRAMNMVDTELVIFSDANTLLNADSIYNIIRHYEDPLVGAVAGEKRVKGSDGDPGGEGAYWKYESYIKKLDSDLRTVVGAAGELFSIRTRLYEPLPENIIIEDFVQSMLVCRKGHVVRYEPEAFAMESASLSLADEKERKIRIAAGGFQAIVYLRDMLNIFHYGLVSFQYISHRVLRWTLCPLSLITLLLSSFAIYIINSEPIYSLAFFAQLFFYTAAVSRLRIFYIPFYFCFMNACVIAGFFRYIGGRQSAVWAKARRSNKI